MIDSSEKDNRRLLWQISPRLILVGLYDRFWVPGTQLLTTFYADPVTSFRLFVFLSIEIEKLGD